MLEARLIAVLIFTVDVNFTTQISFVFFAKIDLDDYFAML